MPPNYAARKRRRAGQPQNKNELKVSRSEAAERDVLHAGTLRSRFPRIQELRVEFRLVTASDAVLNESRRNIDLDEPFLLNVTCEGACSKGVFLLTDAVDAMLKEGREELDGMALCQAVSYMDPRLPCGTKLYYHVAATYSGE
jgi:hypothetical protein